MRPLFIFFLFICLHQLGGCTSACASKPDGTGHSPAHNQAKAQQVERRVDTQDFLLSGHHDFPGESEFPPFAEDDDNREDSTKKTRSPVEGFSAYFCALMSGSPANDLTKSLFFRRQPSHTSSCRYIELRVLRI